MEKEALGQKLKSLIGEDLLTTRSTAIRGVIDQQNNSYSYHFSDYQAYLYHDFHYHSVLHHLPVSLLIGGSGAGGVTGNGHHGTHHNQHHAPSASSSGDGSSGSTVFGQNHAYNRYHRASAGNNNQQRQFEAARTVATGQKLHDRRKLFESDVASETSKKERYLIPLYTYVASDDGSVLKAARERGLFVNKEGISQQAAGNIMVNYVSKHHEISHNAAIEIIMDIFLLSQCSTLIGLASSQVYRMAVAMSNVTGILKYSKVLDYKQIHKVRQMSEKYWLPMPEEFV